MRTCRHVGLLALSLSVGCLIEPEGTQIGSLRDSDPSPEPPVDFMEIDIAQAVQDALAFGGVVTLASAWTGHISAMELAPTSDCPAIWVGNLPEDIVDIDMDDDDLPGISWLSSCTTAPGNVTYNGFTHWTTEMTGLTGARSLLADAEVTDNDGAILFDFDGTASDALDLTNGFSYASSFDGEITGTLAGIGSGLRASNATGGEDDDDSGFAASWSADGSMAFNGTVTAFDGFGPADTRSPDAPELLGITDWTPGMPRFTSVRFDLAFGPDCSSEPIGYIGLRGNEGFWFDVYFLPNPEIEVESAAGNAFPTQLIDNQICDGFGTLFARNLDLSSEGEDVGWSREFAPDFGAALSSLPTPTLESYIYTLRHVPEN